MCQRSPMRWRSSFEWHGYWETWFLDVFSEQGYWTIPQDLFAQGNHTFCPLVQLSSTYPVETSVILSHIPTFQYVRCCFSCILREDKPTMFQLPFGTLTGRRTYLADFLLFFDHGTPQNPRIPFVWPQLQYGNGWWEGMEDDAKSKKKTWNMFEDILALCEEIVFFLKVK